MNKLVIVASDRAGIYAKISITLVRNGVVVTERSVEKIGDGLSQFVLSVNSNEDLIISTVKILEEIDGVDAVEILGTSVGEPLPSPTQGRPGRRNRGRDSSQLKHSGDVLDELIFANPDIVGIVRKYANSLSDNDIPVKLYTMGKSFSKAVTKIEFTQPIGSIGFACDEFVIPLISPFSFVERRGNNVVISLCPFCRDSAAANRHCSFLHGVVAGIIRSCPEWDQAEVTEKSSQAAGDSECVFGISLQ